ncbi:MAG: hypothetical protein NTX15_00365 [Candidatus Kapabacteria bacterium]|nr:hypothetical protein [Candidatus Kapabacteria bacterium]
MNADLTELVLIIDASGSMEHLQQETISSVNGVVRDQLSQAGEILDLTIAVFNTTVDVLLDGKRVSRPNVLSKKNYKPDGCTALHDAVVDVINSVGVRLAARAEADLPSAVVVVIVTDGEENASTHHRLADVARVIDHQQKVYNWQFLFLGANQDSWTTGQAMNIDVQDAKDWTPSKEGMELLQADMISEIHIRKQRAKGL